jgi:hypothetical protein
VGHTGKDGEPCIRPPRAIPSGVSLAAAEKAEELDRVRRRKDVGIACDDHRGRFELRNLIREVEIFLHQVAELAEEARKVLWSGCDAGVKLIHRRLLHHLGRLRPDLRLLGEDVRVERIAFEVGRDNDELADEIRVSQGCEEGDPPAQRVAHEVGPVELQVLDQRRDVAGHQLRAEWPIDVGCAAVSLQIDSDDLAAFRKGRQGGAEHRYCAETAVQKDKRMSCSEGLVVELDAVHVRIFADAFRLASPRALSFPLELFLWCGDASRC